MFKHGNQSWAKQLFESGCQILTQTVKYRQVFVKTSFGSNKSMTSHTEFTHRETTSQRVNLASLWRATWQNLLWWQGIALKTVFNHNFHHKHPELVLFSRNSSLPPETNCLIDLHPHAINHEVSLRLFPCYSALTLSLVSITQSHYRACYFNLQTGHITTISGLGVYLSWSACFHVLMSKYKRLSKGQHKVSNLIDLFEWKMPDNTPVMF